MRFTVSERLIRASARLVNTRPALKRLAHAYLRNNNYTYPNGMKAPKSVIDFIEAEAAGQSVPPPGGTHAQIPSQPSSAKLGRPSQMEALPRG